MALTPSFAQLEEIDVKELSDGRYQITVRGVSLKGQKGDKVLYVLFQPTIPLLRYWLHVVRPKAKPKSNRLLVSKMGKPFTKSGIRGLVRNCCMHLGVFTVKGKVPSPHTLRHTLATLNTEPFGKSLSPRMMQQRLMHVDLETLERNYVHNNPLGEMKEYKKLLERGVTGLSSAGIDKETFFKILDSLSFAKSASVTDVKEAYEREFEENALKHSTRHDDETISEREAVRRLADFCIDFRALRSWGLKQGICRILSEKTKGRYVYDKAAIFDLAKNYVDRISAYRKFSGSRSNFYKRLKVCRRMEIGRKTLILKDDLLQFMIEDVNDHSGSSDRIKEPSPAYLFMRSAKAA